MNDSLRHSPVITLLAAIGLLLLSNTSLAARDSRPKTQNSGLKTSGASGASGASGGHVVWWEAEKPASTNFPRRNPFAPLNAKEAGILSAGKWIGVGGKSAQPLYLAYNVRVDAAGEYQFYARKFWKHGPFRWRFDDQPWQTCSKDVALLDHTPMRQFVGADWVSLGKVTLGAGVHALRIELLKKSGPAAFDCFVLAHGPFVPRGKLKPGQKLAVHASGWFAFQPDADRFAPSAIDLRFLNEKKAGDGGPIAVRDGGFIHSATGKPVRFWAIDAGPDIARMDRASVDHLARLLAKYGVNMVRFHGPLWGGDLTQINQPLLDHLFYFIATMKKQGIYTSLSIYFPLWLQPDGKRFPGYQKQRAFGLLYFNPKLQRIYRGWWKAILNTPNPYTGSDLAHDPAVAFAELVNEDSLLFWTFKPYKTVPAPQMAILEKDFGDWLTKKYGSVGAALKAWGGKTVRGDDAAAGRAGFLGLYNIIQQRKTLRAQDTAAFLTSAQQRFYADAQKYLKEALGFQGLVYGSNWKTADPALLDPLDKYSNTVCDFLDRHGYFAGPDKGARASYALDVGDQYADRTALIFDPAKPLDIPLVDVMYNGKPSTITELNWSMPNRFRTEMVPLTASYGSLQGTDGVFFFCVHGAHWQRQENKFPVETPEVMGQFPAFALAYRRGLIDMGKPAANIQLKLSDLFALHGAPVRSPQNFDALRAKNVPPGAAMTEPDVKSIDPLAPLVGPVRLNITADKQPSPPSRIMDLRRSIDRGKGIVRSNTGELLWNYKQGLVTIDAPAIESITGFLDQAGTVKLRDATITSTMPYGSIALVSLNGKPIAQSRKLLLQVMSEAQNHGWSPPGSAPGSTPGSNALNAQGQGPMRTITSLGSAPIVIRDIAGSVALHRADAKSLRVTALNFNGYPTQAIGTADHITLLPDVLYYLIEAK